MDDSKSDNTDELLSSIEPLLQQSEYIMNQKDYKNNRWVKDQDCYDSKNIIPVIVDDILSSRSVAGYEWKDTTMFQSPSIANLASHNSKLRDGGLESERTLSSHFYEASISLQSTPRNISVNKHSFHMLDEPSISWKCNDESIMNTSAKQESRIQDELEGTRASWNQSKIEIQRLQLNNKQLSTQLHEAKLSIQTLSIQLEQVQQESKHKENTLSNLDNTLGKLVSGWKKRESQKDQDLDSMKQQVEIKDKVIEETQRIAEESRRALSNADKAVQMEKNRTEQHLKNAGIEIQNLKKEKEMLIKNNTELTNHCVNMETEIKKLNGLHSENMKKIDVLNLQIKDNYGSWKREIDNYKKDIDILQEEITAKQFEIKSREDIISQMKSEIKLLEEEFYRCRLERDNNNNNLSELRGSMKKMQEEHSFTLKKQEKESQNQWQQKMNKTLLSIQDQNKKAFQLQHNNFQTKLNEQSKRHRKELENLRHVAEQEIASRVSDSQDTIAMLRERLERSEKSVQFWQQEKEVVEKARNQISSKLWEIMNTGQPNCALATNTVSELIKPIFVPPKNQNLQQTMPNNFFEPIKSYSTSTFQSQMNT